MIGRRILIIGVILFFLGAGSVQAQYPVTARVDRTTLPVDEQVTLTVTVTADSLNTPTPDISGLIADFRIAGSGSSTQLELRNGKLTTQQSFIFHLEPLRPGLLIIPPIPIQVDGQSYATDPISVEVLPANAPPVPGESPPPARDRSLDDQDFFVEAEVDNLSPYLGQQVIYTFRLYQATTFFGQPDYKQPPFTNFLGRISLPQSQYNVNTAGQDYFVTEIKTALFPADVGEITIEPAKLIIPGGIFEPDIVLETETIVIEARSLPKNAPPNFEGAVGQFEIEASLSEREGKVNEPLTLIIEITGAGNIEYISEPTLPPLSNWRVFEGQDDVERNVDEAMVYGTHRFERLIVPGQSGQQTIPPISFSFYDPQQEEYITVESEPIRINILPGDSDPSPSLAIIEGEKQPVTVIGGDIRHIKPVPPSLRSSRSSVLAHPLYWGCWLLPLFVVAGVWIFQKRRERFAQDEVYARRQLALRKAHKILVEARHSDNYAAAQRALLGYLSDKLNRPTTGLTNAAFRRLLEEYDIPAPLIERMEALLQRIEVSRFAPVGEKDAQSILSDTKQLINDLDQVLKKRW